MKCVCVTGFFDPFHMTDCVFISTYYNTNVIIVLIVMNNIRKELVMITTHYRNQIITNQSTISIIIVILILIITTDITSNYQNHIIIFSIRNKGQKKQRVRTKVCWVVGLMRRSVIIKNKLGSFFLFFFLHFFSYFHLFFSLCLLNLKFENLWRKIYFTFFLFSIN